MPEGHTLFALARDLDAAFAGTSPRVTSPQGRFADGAALLDGHEVVRALARGKHLFVEFAGERWLNVHLGLIGKFTVRRFDAPLPRARWDDVPVTGQVRLRLVTAHHVADLRGPTRCVVITDAEAKAVLDRLGPDPLRDGEFGADAWKRVRRSRRSVAELLMDQSIIAGVGNVYRSEVLFRHRVSPFVTGEKVKKKTWTAIWDDLAALMPLGVETGRIITVDEEVEAARTALAAGRAVGPAGRESYVYKRAGQPCRVCGHRVNTRVVAGRNLFWCGTCQRRY